MLKRYFFPVVDKEVQKLMDETSTKSIENISIIVAIFESITLAFFILTRKSIGREELISIHSVVFCILTCLVGFLVSNLLLKKGLEDHWKVVVLNTVYYMLMALWAMWSSHSKYADGEQMLTFYAVEVMLVCFIVLKPWFSMILAILTYVLLFGMIYQVDHAAGINPINYFILTLVSGLGMAVRYNSLMASSEATIKLQKAKDTEIQDKMNILKSIADIYDKVNLIDFKECTEMSVRGKEQKKHTIDLENMPYTIMTRKIREHVMPDQLQDFIRFTNIGTVQERLIGKRLISDDFIDVVDGWFRAQYIPVEVDENSVPTQVVFTTRNVDEEKQREERLIRIAMTDELTRLFNRRSYEEDLAEFAQNGLPEDFVILSADVNGLKKVNDTKGHAGGDELIKGAAECLLLAIGSKGKVYRVGGDEFAAILKTDDMQAVCRDIENQVSNWYGQYSHSLSLSIGYASYTDNKELNIHELERRADDAMYKSKAEYYEKKGIDRRGDKRIQ